MKVERTEGLAWRKVGEETVVIHLARHRIFGLNGAAGRLWEALQEGQDLEDLETIATKSAESGADIVDAVHYFVADMASEGLVDVTGELPQNNPGDTIVDFPRIEWREELQQFAGQCHLVPGQSHQCNQHPGNS